MDERWIEVRTDDGVRLSARVIEARRAGAPTLVLHHGLASSQRIWDLTLPHLRGLRVITFDARGHGRSGKPSSGFGFDRTVADLFAVTRAARARRPVVAGHSWGATVALEAGARRPRSLAGIHLIDGGFGALGREMSWAQVKEHLAPPHLTGMTVQEFRAMIRTFWGEVLEVTPDVETIVMSLMRVRPDGTITPHLRRANHFKILRAIWEQDPVPMHARLTIPAAALLARAGGEPEWERAKHEATRAVRLAGGHTRVTWIEGIHDLPLQHPAEVAAHLRRFVRRAVG